MSPTSRENGRKTWRGPRRWDIHTSALLIFRRLEVSRKTMEIRAFSSALADGIEISLRRRNPIVGARGIRDSFLPISESFPLSPRERFAADLELGRISSIVQWTPIRNLHCYKLIILDRAWWCPFVLEKQATGRVIAIISRDLESWKNYFFRFLRSSRREVKIPYSIRKR